MLCSAVLNLLFKISFNSFSTLKFENMKIDNFCQSVMFEPCFSYTNILYVIVFLFLNMNFIEATYVGWYYDRIKLRYGY
jgi:hypothetical protein